MSQTSSLAVWPFGSRRRGGAVSCLSLANGQIVNTTTRLFSLEILGGGKVSRLSTFPLPPPPSRTGELEKFDRPISMPPPPLLLCDTHTLTHRERRSFRKPSYILNRLVGNTAGRVNPPQTFTQARPDRPASVTVASGGTRETF